MYNLVLRNYLFFGELFSLAFSNKVHGFLTRFLMLLYEFWNTSTLFFQELRIDVENFIKIAHMEITYVGF